MFVHLGNAFDPLFLEEPKDFVTQVGYERGAGTLNFDRAKQAFTRFDVIARRHVRRSSVDNLALPPRPQSGGLHV